MADFQNLTVNALSSANVNVPRFTISVQVTDSTTGAVLADFTGANTLTWPGVLSTLTAAQRREVLELIVNYVIQVKAGLI